MPYHLVRHLWGNSSAVPLHCGTSQAFVAHKAVSLQLYALIAEVKSLIWELRPHTASKHQWCSSQLRHREVIWQCHWLSKPRLQFPQPPDQSVI
jgi:hypothetical protein